MSESTKHITIDGATYSVAWQCHYRDHTTYVARRFGSDQRFDLEVGDDGSFGKAFGGIDQSLAERIITEYERVRREEFVSWCLRQSYNPDPNEYKPHAILTDPKPYGWSMVEA